MSPSVRDGTREFLDQYPGAAPAAGLTPTLLPPMPLTDSEVVAVACSDVHFWPTPPVARSVEPDWLGAQARPLDEIKALQKIHHCPVVIAGDIFHHYDPAPELVNWLLDNLPDDCYAVAGNHDLVNNRLADLHKTAYGTLVRAGRLTHLERLQPVYLRGLTLWGFSWGEEVVPCPSGDVTPFGIHVAVVHKYVWREGSTFPGAKAGAHVSALYKELRGYHAAVIGDNHAGFLADNQTPVIFNGGTLMRRRQDERDYKPAVGLLHADGTMTRYLLDCSQDVFLEPTEKQQREHPAADFDAFLAGLDDLGDSALDYAVELQRGADAPDFPAAARVLISDWLRGHK